MLSSVQLLCLSSGSILYGGMGLEEARGMMIMNHLYRPDQRGGMPCC